MTPLEAAQARGFQLRPSASDADVAALTAFCATPVDLVGLLRETDGVFDEFGSAVVWPAAQIVAENQAMRANPDFPALYWSFDQILFVGEEGGGDLFGFRLLTEYDGPDDIYLWEHESDNRVWFALSLADYFARRS